VDKIRVWSDGFFIEWRYRLDVSLIYGLALQEYGLLLINLTLIEIEIMKPIPFLLAAFLICSSAKAQPKDTVKAYDYLNFYDAWKLRLLKNDSFELVLDNTFFPNGNFLAGKYIINNDSIHLLPGTDTFSIMVRSSIKESDVLKDPIKELVNGASFLVVNEYIVPVQENKKPDTSLFGKYYRGNDEGRTEITIFKNGSFTITVAGCKSKFISKGRYIKKGDFITFIHNKRAIDLITRLTRDQTVFVKNNYLICRNFEDRITSYVNKNVVVDKTVTDDVFSYFIKIE
jgi:hypothetical protein